MKETGFEVFQNYTNEEDAYPLIDLLQQNQIDYVFEPPSNPGEYTIVKNFLVLITGVVMMFIELFLVIFMLSNKK